MNADLIKRIREITPNMIAQELVDIQPIHSNIFSDLMASAFSDDQLVKEGYKPVSKLGLLWVKDNEEEIK
jgi:hypothetical protein